MENDVEPDATRDVRGQITSLDDVTFANHHTHEDFRNGDFSSSRDRLDFHRSSTPPEHNPGSDVYPPPGNDDVIQDQDHRHHVNVDDSLDSVIVEDRVGEDPYAGHLKGLENEAYSYDGDAETDLSYSNPTSPVDPPVRRNPDPFPVLERPLSGRYQKNPILEKNKATAAPGPYDPNVGLYLAPPLATTKTSPPSATAAGGGGGGEGRAVRRRLPQPPSRLRMRCAFAWSCLACLIGNFLCAIPALRYFVTANESRKIGDYNSANSNLRKTAILAAVALILGVGAWVVVILHLSGSL